MKDKWINVTDKLPEGGERCLVFSKKHNSIEIATLSMDQSYWYDEDGCKFEVTYWQCLPDKP